MIFCSRDSFSASRAPCNVDRRGLGERADDEIARDGAIRLPALGRACILGEMEGNADLEVATTCQIDRDRIQAHHLSVSRWFLPHRALARDEEPGGTCRGNTQEQTQNQELLPPRPDPRVWRFSGDFALAHVSSPVMVLRLLYFSSSCAARP